jgi:hypothetical protein
MAVSLEQLLSSHVITRVISRIKTPQSALQSWFGMLPGGPNVNPVGGRRTGWDIFDRTRLLAKGRAPGTGPASSAPQVIGHVLATIYRSHEKILLQDERLFRTRPLGRGWGEVDVMGQRYVAAQQAMLAQKFYNVREFMISRMLRGGFYLHAVGNDDLLPSDVATGSLMTVDYRVPSGNKGRLDMLGEGNILDTTWSAANTDIPKHLFSINRAFEQLHGRPLRHVWLNSKMFAHVLNNNAVKGLSGTANVVFSEWAASPYTSAEGVPDTGHTVVLRGLPWLTWHVYDAGLEVWNGSTFAFTQFFPDNYAAFLPDPGNDWVELHEGSEIVRENLMDPGTERYGLFGWSEPTTQPAGFELIMVDNCLPALYVPKCVAWGNIVF